MTSTLQHVRLLVTAGDYRVSADEYDELEQDGLFADEIVHSASTAVLVEDYPDAVRGPPFMSLQHVADGSPVHVV